MGESEMKKIIRRIARIFEEPNGQYYICDNALDYLDARGRAYKSRQEAIAALKDARKEYPKEYTYTHYLLPSGTIKKL